MLLINYFFKILIIFFIAIQCAFALHDNPIFYQAEKHFIHGAFDESQHFLNQLTQDHLLKNVLLMLIKKPNASKEKNVDNPLENLKAIDRTVIYINTLNRKISDNTFFLCQKHNVKDDNIELCFTEACQALYVCFRVARKYQHKTQETFFIKKLEGFCQLASTLIAGSPYQQLLGAQMLNIITKIFCISHIDYLYANYLSAQCDLSILDPRSQHTEYAKKLYLRLSTQDEFFHNAFHCISFLYWKQLQYEQFFLWFSKSVDNTCFYSTLNTFVSKELTELSKNKNYVNILLLLTAYRFTYYKNDTHFMAKFTKIFLLQKDNLFQLLKARTYLWQINKTTQRSTIGNTYYVNFLLGLYYYIIGEHYNALKYLYYAFTQHNDAQSYYYLVHLFWSQITESQRQRMLFKLTPPHISRPHSRPYPDRPLQPTPDPTINEQSIFLQQLSTSQLLKLATRYLTMHHYNITGYLLHYLINNYPLCFEIISAKYLQGVMYELGYYYEKNANTALHYYEDAANTGLPLAMYDLGRLYAISEQASLTVIANTLLDKATQRKALQSPSSLYMENSTTTK